MRNKFSCIALCSAFLLTSCDSGKDTVVVEKEAPVEVQPPITACDQQTKLGEYKLIECGFGNTGVRVMVCTGLGWEEAFKTCK